MAKVTMTPIKIQLGDMRRRSQSSVHESKHSLREEFGLLSAFDEVMLKPGGVITQQIGQTGIFFLLPVLGACEIINTRTHAVDVGGIHFSCVEQHEVVRIKNPYAHEWVRFITWQINGNPTESTALQGFDLNLDLGNLVRIFKGAVSGQRIAIRAGMFEGRGEGRLSLPNANHFIFVLEGVFEVQNRLLHAHDALSIPGCPHLDFEALSSHAILLVVSQF
jgi:quercetin 2,3-dioxygenase